MIDITDHLAQIRARVTQALSKSGRSHDDVTIVAVSKQQPADAIRRAFANGITDFGESYVDEALPKLRSLTDIAAQWHFIGRIQSNKTRAIAENFQWVHSVDRERIARRLDAQRPHHASPLNVLIQVNLAGESQKGGVELAAAPELARVVESLQHLQLRGLMTIPPADLAPHTLLETYSTLRELGADLRRGGHRCDVLSMGMSRDFETAIAAGSNCVRIGTAVFGPRPQ